MKKLLLFVLIVFLQSCSKDVPEVPLIDITLNETEIHLNPGDSFQLAATFKPEKASDKELNWISSIQSVATVSPDGKVTANSIGETTITANNVKYNKSASANIIVSPLPIKTIKLSPASLNLKIGEKETIKIETTPAEAPQVGLKWTSSDPEIASVNSEGEVTALKKGDVNITVTTAEGSISASLPLKVSPIWVESIILNKSELIFTEGASERLTANILPSNATEQSLSWVTFDDKIATVNSDGTVNAISEGNTKIMAESRLGSERAWIYATANITVIPRVYSIVNKSYEAADGITVTLKSFEVYLNEHGTYSYYISYTLENKTRTAIDENTFQMYYVDKNMTVNQYGFFTTLFPGQSITRLYTFHSTEELGILEYGASSFSNIPEGERLQWQAPKVK